MGMNAHRSPNTAPLLIAALSPVAGVVALLLAGAGSLPI
jgi:hypothetical protein